MIQQQIDQLATVGTFNGHRINGTVLETPISWVILSGRNAFKIKKPIQLPFLDYSTLRKRKQMAELEIELNRRFSNIYKGVLPIHLWGTLLTLGHDAGNVVDYAVHMKRLATSKRMDLLLAKHHVRDETVHTLATKIAAFHKSANVIETPFRIREARNLFNDVKMILTTVGPQLEPSDRLIIKRSITWSNAFLTRHKDRFQARIIAGLKRDLHGDLHSGNVFLYEDPVLFDCIEFNDTFRQIDVLYEIAFLCMDLDGYHEERKSQLLLRTYLDEFNCLMTPEDELIFRYFKVLRANVRAKVHAIGLAKESEDKERSLHLGALKKYLHLMQSYMDDILR